MKPHGFINKSTVRRSFRRFLFLSPELLYGYSSCIAGSLRIFENKINSRQRGRKRTFYIASAYFLLRISTGERERERLFRDWKV